MLDFRAAIEYANANETNWSRDTSSGWGIHSADTPPWNRLLGPVYPRGPASGVICVGGQVAAQWGEPDRADLTFSVAKTYLALLAGVAWEKGLLGSLDEPVAKKVKNIGFESAQNQSITWRHLLQQTSEFEGSCFGVPDQVDRYRHLSYQPASDVAATGFQKGDARPLQTPGSFWEYNDVRINQLSLALLHVFKEPLPEVFRRTIADPSGASSTWRWEGYDNSWVDIDGRLIQSVPGGTHWGGGVSISAHDQALIGQMMLNKGFVGQSQVVASQWLEWMQTPCTIAPWYGMLVWLNTAGSIFKNASRQSYFCIGAGASVVWVEPAFDMVAVVRWIDGEKVNGFCEAVYSAMPQN